MPHPGKASRETCEKLLSEMFNEKSVDSSTRPLAAWKKHKAFQQCFTKESSGYRNIFRRVKSKFEDANPIEGRIGFKRKRVDFSRLLDDEAMVKNEEDVDDHINIQHHSKVPIVDEEQTGPDYHPVKLHSECYEQGKTAKRLTMAIWLPSGLQKKDISFNISKCGTNLELTVLLPSFMCDSIELHDYWISLLRKFSDGIDIYHSVIIGFESFLKFFGRHKIDRISLTDYISLPFEVETHFQTKTRLSFMNGTCNILYVTMRFKVDKYDNQAAAFVDLEVECLQQRDIGPTADDF